jgi:hypothetical protein
VSVYAVVDQSGTVINRIEWGGDQETWSPPEGCDAVPCPDGVSIGWKRNGDGWAPPDPDAAAAEPRPE